MSQDTRDDWKLVPVQATAAMRDAWDEIGDDFRFNEAYAAMLAASPAPSVTDAVPVDRIRIEKPEGLDSITVYLENHGPGQGRAVIVCYSSAWNCYWGGMGGRTVREFIADCDEHYIGGCMTSMSYHRVTKQEQAYADRVAKAVITHIAALNQRDRVS